MSGGAVVTIAKVSVVALGFLFTLLTCTCVGILQFPFLTVNGPRLCPRVFACVRDYQEKCLLISCVGTSNKLSARRTELDLSLEQRGWCLTEPDAVYWLYKL